MSGRHRPDFQQAAKRRRSPGSVTWFIGGAVLPEVFVQRLRELGYSEGRHDVMTALARELVDLNVDVIMAFGDEAIAAANKTTSTIPIVM